MHSPVSEVAPDERTCERRPHLSSHGRREVAAAHRLAGGPLNLFSPAHVAKGEQNEPCRLVEPDPVRRTPGRGQVMMLPGLQVTQRRILSVRSRRALVRWVQLGGDRGGASSPHTHCHLVSVTRPVTWLGPVPANTGHVDFILKAPPL